MTLIQIIAFCAYRGAVAADNKVKDCEPCMCSFILITLAREMALA